MLGEAEKSTNQCQCQCHVSVSYCDQGLNSPLLYIRSSMSVLISCLLIAKRVFKGISQIHCDNLQSISLI